MTPKYAAIYAGGKELRQIYDEGNKCFLTPLFASLDTCSDFWRRRGNDGAWGICEVSTELVLSEAAK